MEASQIHLSLNHFPIAGVIFSLLFFVLSFIFRGKRLEHTSMFLLIVSGIFILPVYLSGEKVKSVVSRKAFVSKYYIQEHEEKAEKTLVIMVLTSLMALAWVIASNKNKSYTNILLYTVFSLNLLLAWSVYQTGHEGGKIRHDQLRGNSGAHLEMD